MVLSTGRVSRLDFNLAKEGLETAMKRPTLLSERQRMESHACERKALVSMIEALHTAILTKADPKVIGEELDALTSFAERWVVREMPLGICGQHPVRARRAERDALLAELNGFRRVCAGRPDSDDLARLYDFLSDWLIETLYGD